MGRFLNILAVALAVVWLIIFVWLTSQPAYPDVPAFDAHCERDYLTEGEYRPCPHSHHNHR